MNCRYIRTCRGSKMADVLQRFALCLVLLHGVWAELSKCGHPGPPANVVISEPADAVDLEWFPIGTELTFACLNQADILQGDIKRICLDDGTWTDSSPWCESNYIIDKPVKGQNEEIHFLTDGRIQTDDENDPVECMETQTNSERTFTLPIEGIDSISSIIIHIEDSPDNFGMLTVQLDGQEIRCEPTNLTVFKCPIESEGDLVPVEGLLVINSQSPSLSLCEVEVYSRSAEISFRGGPMGASNRSLDFYDDSSVDYDVDTGMSVEKGEEDMQEIVMIFVGLTLGTAVASVVLAKVYSAYCSKKGEPTKDYYVQVPTVMVNGHKEIDPQFIQHVHNPKLSI